MFPQEVRAGPVSLGCISLLTEPWSLANSNEREGGKVRVWELWVYFWLLRCETVGEGINRVWGRSQTQRFSPGKRWMDLFMDGFVYCSFTLSPHQVEASKGAPLSAWVSFGGCLKSPPVHRPWPLWSLSFWICSQITNFLICQESWYLKKKKENKERTASILGEKKTVT